MFGNIAVPEKKFVAGFLPRECEVCACRLRAEISGMVVYAYLKIYDIAALLLDRGAQYDRPFGCRYGFVVTYLHLVGHAARAELAENDPAADLIGKGCLYSAMQGIAPALEFGARIPDTDYFVTVLVELHSQARLVVGIATVAVVAFHAAPWVYDFFHDVRDCLFKQCKNSLSGKPLQHDRYSAGLSEHFCGFGECPRAFCEAVPAEYDTGAGNIELQSGCIIRKIIISLPRKRKDAGVVELARLESE